MDTASLPAKTLHPQSILIPSLNFNGSSSSETVGNESIGDTSVKSNSLENLDGYSTSAHIKAVSFDDSQLPQSSNSNACLPIEVALPESEETLGGYSPSSHIEASANLIESRDHESVVPSLSYGDGSPSSSSVESVDDQSLVPSPSRETLHADDGQVPMEIDADKGPSSPFDLRLVDEEDLDTCERKHLSGEQYGPWRPFYGHYHHQNHNDESHHLPPHLAHRRRKWCGHPKQMCLGFSRRDMPCSDAYDCSREVRLDRMLPWHPSRVNGENRAPLDSSCLVQETQPTGLGAGLSNLGNTCFMNAILQCFTHTVPLVKALVSSNHAVHCESGIEGFCVFCALYDHIKLSLASSGKILSPWKLVDNLDNISFSFQRYQQEDAHEYLQCLLDRLERCCLDSNQLDCSSCSLDKNIVDRVFGGRLVSKLQCCNCGHRSDKYEPLIDLSLEIEAVGSIKSALESFTQVEKIEDPETKFSCDSCKEEVSREKQLMLDKIPVVAALHLKRFKSDGFSVEKIGKHVEFPLELDFKPYTNCSQDSKADMKYQLYAVVVHNGFLPTSGHYFCYIRSSPDKWHKLDDSMVAESEEQYVLSQAAYILFYAREDIPWFSSFIESQKLCLDPNISNTSPKSVLDNMDQCTTFPGAANDNCTASITRDKAMETSTHVFRGTMVEEIQTNETRNESEGISAQVSNGSGPSLGCNEFSGDTPILDVPVPLGASNLHHEVLQSERVCGLPSTAKNKDPQDDRIGKNIHHPSTPPRSFSADMNFRGLPEGRYHIPREHLKAESQVNCRRPPKKVVKDLRRVEAVRYASRMMPAARAMKLMAAMSPRNDKKRLRSSPCKRSSLPTSRRKTVACGSFGLNRF